MASFDRYFTDRAGHLSHGYSNDAVGHAKYIGYAKLSCQCADGGLCQFLLGLDASSKASVSNTPKHHVGVRYSGVRATVIVTRRPWFGACTPRANTECVPIFRICDAPSTCTDRIDVDLTPLYGISNKRRLVDSCRLSVLY